MSAILTLQAVSVSRESSEILKNVSWSVGPGERWVILGPNGAGKTTLLELVADWAAPTSGTVTVLGDNTTTESPEWIRPRVGIASAGMAKHIPDTETVRDAVLTAAYATATRSGASYEDIDIKRANRVLKEWGLADHADRHMGTLSEGEVKRVQLARAIMTDPELLLLDEPTAGLDLGSREELLLILSHVSDVPSAPTVVMVTHHVEEIPRGFTHVLILARGKVVAAGPIQSTLTSEHLSAAYDMSIEVTNLNGRYTAHAQFNL